MPRISKDNLGKGAAFLYIENTTNMISAYVFWIVISKITRPEIIGVSAVVVSIAAIATTVATMGIPISVQRFLGRALGTQRTENIRTYITSSCLLLALSLSACITFLLFIGVGSFEITRSINFRFDFGLVILTLIMISSSSTSRLLRGIIIASLNTKILATATICSTAIKFALAFLLLSLGMGATGLIIGITSFSVFESVMMSINLKKVLGGSLLGISRISLKTSMHDIFVGGLPNWIPNLFTAFGSQLGTVLVFGSHGASQAGFYFLAFSIYSAIATGMGVLFSITYPILSSLDKGMEKLSHRTIKMSLLLSIPPSYSVIFFSNDIMNIFGPLYSNGSSALQILLLSIMPVALMSGITNLVYAMGMYRYTLLIGVTSSIPRTILYFVLVPLLGGTGAALSFTIGSFTGFVLSIIVAKRVGMPIAWKEIITICVIPLGISYIFSLTKINFLISIVITLVFSYIIYIRGSILLRADIHDALNILPKTIAGHLERIIDFFGKKLNNSY